MRVLTEDLQDGWEDAAAARAVNDGRWAALHPLSGLPHPLVRKAAETFGPEPSEDPPYELIQASGELRLLELRTSQWRGGVWTDPETGVRWLCAAGLAKGDHEDFEDFYVILGRRDDLTSLLPTDADWTLLKRETAAAQMTRWELEVQGRMHDVLVEALADGRSHVTLPTPDQKREMARVEIQWALVNDEDDDYEDLVVVVDLDRRSAGSNLGWQLTLRVLISLSPPAQDWDRHQDTYSTLNETGHAERQAARLAAAVSAGELLTAEPGAMSHYTPSRHLTENTVLGKASRALCGVFFVPTQDHEELPKCPHCAAQYAALPG
jgi:hypothetical protein